MDENIILYVPSAMTRRVDRERSILGTELEEPKQVARGGDVTKAASRARDLTLACGRT